MAKEVKGEPDTTIGVVLFIASLLFIYILYQKGIWEYENCYYLIEYENKTLQCRDYDTGISTDVLYCGKQMIHTNNYIIKEKQCRGR